MRTITITTILFAINVYAASTGINTELNESAIVRLSGAIAMGNNTDRIVTRDAVASVLSGYNIGSSVVTVTDDVTNDFIIVKYSATSREYKIDKNTIYTITYNANGGSGAPASQEHKHNGSTTLSTTVPTRSNYRFRGWSTSSTATSATYSAGGTYTTNGDVTLYAVWQAMYTVSYNANNGSGAPASQIKYHDETLTLQTGTPTRSNYRFRGWSTSSSATSAEYQPGGSFTTNANTTLYAVWQAIYTITYNANGGSGAPLAQTKYHGESITLSTTTPTRSNYRFRGWSTSNSATSATYGAGATYSEEGNKTLYAVWQAMYTVTYNANGGSGAPASQTKYHGETLTLQTGTPTRDNHTFLGWSESSSASSATYAAGGSFTTDANTTLYAVWQAYTYTVVYNGNGNTGGSTASSSHTYGVAKNLTANGFTKTGHNFAGWATSASGSVVYSDKQSVTNLTTTNGGTVNLYAKWTPHTYTIAYNANGGSGAPASQTKTYGVNLTLSSTKPTRSGYTFQGWGTSSTTTTVSYQPGATYTANSGTTLYAVWKLNTLSILDNGVLTSGFTLSNPTYGEHSNSSNSFAKYEANTGIRMQSYSLGGGGYVSVCINQAIDVSAFSTLTFVITKDEYRDIDGITYDWATNALRVGLITSNSNTVTPVKSTTVNGTGTYTIDVSNLSGTYYIQLYHGHQYDIIETTVKNMQFK